MGYYITQGLVSASMPILATAPDGETICERGRQSRRPELWIVASSCGPIWGALIIVAICNSQDPTANYQMVYAPFAHVAQAIGQPLHEPFCFGS